MSGRFGVEQERRSEEGEKEKKAGGAHRWNYAYLKTIFSVSKFHTMRVPSVVPAIRRDGST